MNRNLSKLLALVVVTFFGCTATQTKNGEGNQTSEVELIEKSAKAAKVSDYFPSKIITKTFSGGFENEGTKHVVLSVENNQVQILQEDTGTNLIMVYEVTDNQIKMIFSEEEYYSKKKIDKVIPNRNSIIIKAPLEVGNKWEHEFAGFLEITAVDLEVNTPAGKFNALEVTYSFEDYTTKYYYAKELGLVKTISDFATTKLLKVK